MIRLCLTPFILFYLFCCSSSWLWCNSSPVETLIGLYPNKTVQENGTQWIFEYRSDFIHFIPQVTHSLFHNRIQLKNWDLHWFYEKESGERIREDDLLLQANPFRLLCTARYIGSLSLSKKQAIACRPELLLVPACGLEVTPGPPRLPWYKRWLGYHAPARRQTQDKKPVNLLMILIDTLRSDHTPAYGHPFVIAPHIDLLASLGIVWKQSYSASSSTRPSCGSIFSGLQPSAHGAVRHSTDGAFLHDGVPLLAEQFQHQHFETIAVSSNAQITSAFGFDRGFDQFDCPVWESQVTPYALHYLQTVQEPFFMYLHYLAPHQPYQPPSILGSMYQGKHKTKEQDDYCGEITLDDRRIGIVLLELSRQGLLDRTMIWLLSDHGEEFWEHGWNGHGAKVYEETVRTVSVMTYPRFFPMGIHREEPVTHVDILPTLASIFGWEKPAFLHGISLWPCLQEKEDSIPKVRNLFLHHGGGLQNGPHPSDKDALVQDQKKLIWWNQTNEWEFYDLTSDPSEQTNYYDSNPHQNQLGIALKNHLESCRIIADTYRLPIGLTERRALNAREIENLKAMGYIQTND